MIRVNIKELEGVQILQYDLFTESGKLVCRKDTSLTPGRILQLSYVKLYRKGDEDIQEVKLEEPPIIEKIIEKPVNIPLQLDDEVPEEPPDLDSKISPEVRKTILKSTRDFLKYIELGMTPDVAICELISEKLVEEVANKIDEINYLGQLRVFDEYTYSHNVNVSALCVALGIKIGLRSGDIMDLALASLLHDIGKMRIPKEILNKPGRLTDKEFEVMKLHAPLGYKVIKDELNLPFKISRVALEHQERFGGGGYPKGIIGDDIGLFSQICAIADVYDALISKRVYKPPRTSQEAIKIMLSEGSKSFNPGLLYKFTHMANYAEHE